MKTGAIQILVMEYNYFFSSHFSALSANNTGIPSVIEYANLSTLQISFCACLSKSNLPLQTGQAMISSNLLSKAILNSLILEKAVGGVLKRS